MKKKKKKDIITHSFVEGLCECLLCLSQHLVKFVITL